MKATKLLGSVALTAALAMGTVPAFAQATAPTDWEQGVDRGIGGAGVSNTNKMMNVSADTANKNHKTGTGSTAVKASVFDADLQVTVPLQLSVAFASVGSVLTCPSDGTYQIINNGDKSVQLTRIVTTATNFNLVPLKTATDDLASPTYYDTVSPGNRGIAMELDFGNNVKVDLATCNTWTGAGGGTGWLSGASGAPGNITIPGKTPQGINISGATTSFAKAPMSIGYQLATIMEINYTVETA